MTTPDSTIVAGLDITRRLDPSLLFPRPNPLEVDVGCGKGRFLLARAAAHPGVNFIGVERLLRRVRKVDRRARAAGLDNVRLVSLEAGYLLHWMLPDEAVQAYYIFFPDPWPKRRHHRRRLFTPAFLDTLCRTLRPGGLVHVATDHLNYFDAIRGLLGGDARFEEQPPFEPCEAERTDFELTFLALSQPIGRCSFSRRPAALDAAAGSASAPPPPRRE